MGTRAGEADPADLLTISQAAERLGVSVVTLRRWDSAGKFRANRHPINGYRIYLPVEVERLRKKLLAEVQR